MAETRDSVPKDEWQSPQAQEQRDSISTSGLIS